MASKDKKQKKHVFISYASVDEVAALDLVKQLEHTGVKCWISVRDLVPGEDFSDQLHHSIMDAGAFIVVVSSKANESRFVRMETEMAFTNDCPIYPVRIDNVMPEGGLALFLRLQQWTDAFGNQAKSNLMKLASHIKLAFHYEGAEAAAAADPQPLMAQPDAAKAEAEEALPEPEPIPEPKPAPEPARKLEPTPPARVELLGDDAAVRNFIGPNAAWFVENWRGMDRRGTKSSFNIPALLIPPLYFGYRKMWQLMAVMLVFFVVASVVLAIAIDRAEPMLLTSAAIFWLAVMLFSGICFNQLYRQHVRANVDRIAHASEDATIIKDRLQVAGGTSVMAVVGIVFAMLVPVAGTVSYDQDLMGATQLAVAPTAAPSPTPSDAMVDELEDIELAAEYEEPPAVAVNPMFQSDIVPTGQSRRIYVNNECHHPVEVKALYLGDDSIWRQAETANVRASSRYLVYSQSGSVARSRFDYTYYTALSTNGSELRWGPESPSEGSLAGIYKYYGMDVNTDGDFELLLTCEGY